MRSFHPGRIVQLALVGATALASSGCPELNRQPDRSGTTFYSVDDPAGREVRSDRGTQLQNATTDPAVICGPTPSIVSEEGGLPNQSRRAH
jgi:hypothetical protein